MDTTPGDPAASTADEVRRYCAWGQVFKREGRYTDAAAAFAAALQIDPQHADAHNDLGAVFHLVGNDSDAITQYRRALALRPDHLNALSNLGTALLERNDVREAIATYEHALEIGSAKPEPTIAVQQAKVRTFLGLAQLLNGNLKHGWQNYQSRWAAGATRPASTREELWLGQSPLVGKTIWLANEQGLGDMIQFVRYVNWVAAQNPAKLYLEAPAALERLFSISFGDRAEIRCIQESATLPYCDEVTTVPSLALAAGTQIETIPNAVPYLRAPTPREDTRWRLDTLPRGLRVGLVWAGNQTHSNDARRSIPWAKFVQALSPGHVCYVSLQKEVPTADITFAKSVRFDDSGADASLNRSTTSVEPTPRENEKLEITDFRDCLHDLAETAAVISGLDLVIAVDTSVAHLAGALGKPVWVLLPFAPDWRWMLDRNDSPWYPTMRLFRQPRVADWETVLAEVRAELARLLS